MRPRPAIFLHDRSHAADDRCLLFMELPVWSPRVLSIGMINLWNRLDAATRQVGGEWVAVLLE